MVEKLLDHYLLFWYPMEARPINKANRTIIFPCSHVSIFWTFWLIPARLDRESQNVWCPNKSIKKAEWWGTDIRKRLVTIPRTQEDPEVEFSTSQSTDPRSTALHWESKGGIRNSYLGKLYEIQKVQLAVTKREKKVVSYCNEMLCMLSSQMFLIDVFNTLSHFFWLSSHLIARDFDSCKHEQMRAFGVWMCFPPALGILRLDRALIREKKRRRPHHSFLAHWPICELPYLETQLRVLQPFVLGLTAFI